MPTTRSVIAAAARLAMVLAGAAGMTVGASLLGGCVSREASRPLRAEAIESIRLPDDAWPERRTDHLDDMVRDGPGVMELPGGIRIRVGTTGRYGVGIIRNARESMRWATTRFVSFSTLADRPYHEETKKRIERFEEWNQCALTPEEETTVRSIFEGTRIRVIEPEGGAAKSRGIILHLQGLGTLEYEQPILDELTKRGWTLVRLVSPGVWWYESKPITIASRDDIQPVGERIARIIDDMVAEPAYAAEAVLEYLKKTRPRLEQSPLVVLGFSAGALTTPTVVARIQDRVTAAVLIGGGANLFMLSQRSDLTDGGIRVSWPGELGTAADRERLSDAYLRASRLDPYHTARTMVDKPVLLVQAALDSTVQASGGDLLWERLEQPDRWVFSGGHRLLFWRLGDQAVPIADWIDQAIATPPRFAAQARPPAGSIGAGVGPTAQP